MKKLLIAALCLFALPARAEVGTDVYNVVSGSIITPFGTSSVAVTAPLLNRINRLLCTANCYVAFGRWNASGAVLASETSGVYLAAGHEEKFAVTPTAAMAVISLSGNGNLVITPMSK